MATVNSELQSKLATSVRYAAGTDIGMRREENQDSFGVVEAENFRLFIVADGMGGVKGGAIASSLAIKTVRECLAGKNELLPHSIVSAIQNANTQVFERGGTDTELTGMGTTCVGVAFTGERMFVFNVGDSRVYRIRERKIRQLTEDHTLVGELVRSGAITRDKAANHPVSHMLTRSLGPTPTVDVDCEVSVDGPARGDYFLICSDGLYNLVSQEEMGKVVSDHSLDEAVQILIALANKRGGTDNITVILMSIGEDFPVGPEKFPPDEEACPFGEDTLELNLDSGGGAEMNADVNGYAAGLNGQAKDEGGAKGVPPHAENAAHSKRSEPEMKGESKANAHYGYQGPRMVHESGDKTTAAKHSKSSGMPPLVLGLIIGAFGTVVLGLVGVSLIGQRVDEPTTTALKIVAPVPDFKTDALPLNDERSLDSVGDSGAAGVEEAAVEIKPEPEQAVAQPPSVSDVPAAAGSVDTTAPGIEEKREDQGSKVEARRAKLQALSEELNQKIEAFDKPLSGETGELLLRATRAMDEKKREVEEVKASAAAENRKLQDLYSRRKRIENTEAINLASEVAEFSDEVKVAKDAFEKATWSYLKEAEVLRYNPTDTVQQEKVRSLADARRERMGLLTTAIRHGIAKQISDTDKRIAELSLSENSMNEEVKVLAQEVEYVRILMGNDTEAREKKKKELIRQRKLALAELEELSKMLLSDLDVAN